jgi:uncharacterized protein involved in exopolysaccharide biosynthesis
MQSETSGQQFAETNKQDALPQEVHVLDLLITLSRRRIFIFWLTLAAAVLAAIAVLFVPNKYTATTMVLPPQQNSSMTSALLGQLGGSGGALASVAGAGLGIKNPGDMYVSLFRSRTVEDSVIQRFGLMARYRTTRMTDARRAFEDHSSVILGSKDGLIRIAVTEHDPKFAAEIANGYVDEFRKLSANLAITEASQRRIFFQQQLLDANENLATAEEAMKHTEQSTGVLQIDSQARSLIESAAILRGQIAAKEVQLQAMRSFATEDNPQMVTAGQELAALRIQLAKLSGTNQESSSDIIVPKGNIPEAGMEYIRKLRDVKYYETIMELIAKQFEMAKLDEARQGAVIQVADVAVPPDKKSSPHRAVIVVLMSLIAFVASVLWVLGAARWQQTMRDPEKGRKVQALRQQFFRGTGKTNVTRQRAES